ncbi:TPA: sugar phosphate isomerase/epimerase [Candidatus Latescibacteria bacterium]|nr:sugar phosphate isomerase/epimerase [Candidatus Latescibacterota bacterium]|tara:strand:+ start:269 stop:1039 length:771 start_codon:yes stop_codon:yes gene_type:complete
MPDPVVAAQMYTLREFCKTPADITSSLKRVAEIGYQAVQLSGLGPMDDKELKNVCDCEGLTICATHTGYHKLRDETDAVIEQHNIFECKYPAIGGLPKDCRENGAQGYIDFAKEASQVARKLSDAGMTFGYHNHSFELEKFDGRTALQILFEESDSEVFQFEIDVYWIQHGGADPAAWIRKVKGRGDLVHVKDMEMKGREQLFSEVGEGNLNWPSILEACREAGTRWYIVEQDRCQRDPFESLAISYKNLGDMGLS